MKQKVIGLLVPILAVLIISLIAIFGTIPNIQKYKELKADIANAERELEQTLIPQRDVLAQVDQPEVEKILTELHSIIPAQIDPGLVLGVLEEISARHELTLSRQTFNQLDTVNRMLEFSFNLYGTPEKVNNFLADIENIKPLLYIQQFNFTTEFGESGELFINSNVRIQSPYGVAGVSGEDFFSRGITDNDREIYEQLLERTDYFDTDLSYKEKDATERGKEDPFVE